MGAKRTERGKTKKPSKPKHKRQVRKKEIPLYAYVEERAERIAREIGVLIAKSPVDKGGVIFIHGPVCSGKTIVGCVIDKYVNGKRRFVRAQPKLDRPDYLDGYFYSRRGIKCAAESFSTVRELEDLFDEHDVVVVDAVQFVPYKLQSLFLKEVDEFVERGGWFVCLALLLTSQQTEFLLPSSIRQRAVKVYSLTATCQKCGRRGAAHNQRLVDGKPSAVSDPELVPPSDNVVYEARCKDCLVVFS